MVYPLSISALVSRAARGRGGGRARPRPRGGAAAPRPPAAARRGGGKKNRPTQTSAIDPHTVFKTDISDQSSLSSDARARFGVL